MRKLFYILRFIEAIIAIVGVLFLAGEYPPNIDIYYGFFIKIIIFIVMCAAVFIFDTLANHVKHKYKIYDLD